jgi:hypothetical protein
MQAILGTKKMAEAFDKLPPAEARKRLRKMCEKMDVNNDLVISKDELSRWIEKKFVACAASCAIQYVCSMKSLDLEEADERFEEMDVNNDSRVSWKEYRDESFGIDPDNELDLDDLVRSLGHRVVGTRLEHIRVCSSFCAKTSCTLKQPI